ncbi:hypothetical protein ACM39_11785 [Chryseobacterium sp. FH2]|uniref:matrixin family metalloprotease n=1 Tax=Chryseobacterium sp. FH2 TaxID=1674291 RepID=UPI00065AB5D2|nr:matrixin family metalloprotease [Chryseobacterium sp. FH2]KMQ67550.1 hypothetical protein ACM39_11785 [Chryseobacterium sp. FH2]
MKNSSSFFLLFCLFLFSCSKKQENRKRQKAVTILIQPFKDLKPESINFVTAEIKKVYPSVKILEPIDFPENTYYKPRNRYRADSIIKYLSEKTQDGFVTIGLTSKDISATKGKVADFGLMGLGYRPGKACVASKFRLDKKSDEQFFKIAIHELGHTQGLKHCPEKTCFMRDAEGKNPTDEEKDFCRKCKLILMTKNWKFSSI